MLIIFHLRVPLGRIMCYNVIQSVDIQELL